MDKAIEQLKLCLADMESKDLGRIENRIEEVKFFLENMEEKISLMDIYCKDCKYIPCKCKGE